MFLRTIQVEYGGEPRLINAPIIYETAVLTELVVVATIIYRNFYVTEEHSYSVCSTCRHPLDKDTATV